MKPRKDRVLLDHIPEVLREALAVHEFLRRLGFDAGNIFVMPRPNDLLVVLIPDLSNQDFAFAVSCGSMQEIPRETFEDLWKRAVHLWNGTEPGMSATTRRRIYDTARFMQLDRGLSMLAAMHAKGIQSMNLPPIGSADMTAEGPLN